MQQALKQQTSARSAARTSRKAVRVVRAAAATSAPTKLSPEVVDKCINSIRFLAIDGVNKAKSGHPGEQRRASTPFWPRVAREGFHSTLIMCTHRRPANGRCSHELRAVERGDEV